MFSVKKTAIIMATTAVAAMGMAQAAIVVGGTTAVAIDNQDGSVFQQNFFEVVDGPESSDDGDLFGVNEGPDGNGLLFVTNNALDAFLVDDDGMANAGNLTRLRVRLPLMDGFELTNFTLTASAFDVVSGSIGTDFVQIIFNDMAVGAAGERTVLFQGLFEFSEVAPVPLPGAAILFGTALAGGAAARRRRAT